MRVTRSATVVRGHGHWPIALRLASSISTMTTGRDRLRARAEHLEQIEGAQPQFLKRPRIGEPQRHQRKQEQETHRARHPEFPRPAGDPVHDRQIPAQLRAETAPLVIIASLPRPREAGLRRGGMPHFYFSRNDRMS